MKAQLTLSGIYPTTYSLHLLGLCLLCITACSIFKEKSFYQADSLLRRNTSMQIKTEEETQRQAIRLYTSEDSTVKQSYAEIFPEGDFKFSAKEGFQGKAGRVVIRERVKEGKKVRSSAGLIEKRRLKAERKESQRVVNRNRLKEKDIRLSNSSLVYLVGIVLVFVGVYVFRRFLM